MSENLHAGDPAQQFIHAVASIKSYNLSQTGPVFAFGAMYDGLVQDGGGDAPQVSRLDEAAMTRGVTTGLHADALQEMGVALFDPHTAADYDYSSTSAAPQELRLRLADPEKFAQAVQAFNPSPEQQRAVEDGVDSMLSTTAGLVSVAYSGESAPDEETRQLHRGAADEQLSYFLRVSSVLENRGFDELFNYKRLIVYVNHHRSGTLAEYVGAESKGLTWEPEQFGPGGWQSDSTGEELIERWQAALDYLRTLRDAEDPSPFYSELFRKLRSDFDIARDEINTSVTAANITELSDYSFYKEQQVAMRQVAQIWEQEFPLENSFYLAEQQE